MDYCHSFIFVPVIPFVPGQKQLRLSLIKTVAPGFYPSESGTSPASFRQVSISHEKFLTNHSRLRLETDQDQVSALLSYRDKRLVGGRIVPPLGGACVGEPDHHGIGMRMLTAQHPAFSAAKDNFSPPNNKS
jgi:hypothetical protein